ncbi:MAG: hypothetical protein ACP5HG_00175 [Anaerolineae bacterium]
MASTLLHKWFILASVGALLGLLAGLVVGIGLLFVFGGGASELAVASQPAAYDIEAVVEEDYVNRIMVVSANEMTGSVSLMAGRMDLRPGGVADFIVKVRLGPLRPTLEGRVGFRATEDHTSIEVLLLDARLGRLQLNKFVPESALDPINADIKRLLVDKVGSQGLLVLHVESDETTLRLYLGRDPGGP